MSTTHYPGPLLIVGGGEDKQDACTILREFVTLSGGNEARIAVLTAATNHPYEAGDRYLPVFHQLGVENVHTLHIQSSADAMSEGTLGLIGWCTGLYIIGGSQYRLVRRLAGTPGLAAIHARHRAGMTLGGTSAGAHAMGDIMLVAGQGHVSPHDADIELAMGFGFLSGAITETHFSQRGRMGRLAAAVAAHPSHLGLGLDEDTAILAHRGEWRILGSGRLTILDGRRADMVEASAFDDVTIHTVRAGHRFEPGSYLCRPHDPLVAHVRLQG